MNSDTPRTDACIAEYREGCLDFAWTLTDLTRQLERDLAALRAERDRLIENNFNLGGDLRHIAMTEDCTCGMDDYDDCRYCIAASTLNAMAELRDKARRALGEE